MRYIKIISVCAQGGNLQVRYEVSPDLSVYFSEDRVFEVEYNEDISKVPEGVLVIPFVCNVLPIIWLTDATLQVPQLEREFWESIPAVKTGYKNMSTMLDFKGKVEVSQIVEHSYDVSSNNVASLFSGGVDAYATLITHAEEKPTLITLWGADVKLSDSVGWNIVKKHVESVVIEFGLPSPVLIHSNFRMVVNEPNLDRLIASSGDGWWHGYQHGIGILGHVAPIAFLKRLKTLYIASSFTPDNKTICASDPTIDNELRLVSTRVWHDLYEYHRQQKVTKIVDYRRRKNKIVHLRVCWISDGGTNCCECEKCLRTILALCAEGADPAQYGFSEWRKNMARASKSIPKFCRYTPSFRKMYARIQARFKETNAYRIDADINWIYNVNFMKGLKLSERWKKFRKKLRLLFNKNRRGLV